jgi:N-acetylglutamate synthase-like GNAT family acetyltransferase
MAISIRQAGYPEAEVVAHTVRMSFRDVAEKFEITREAAPTHPSQCEADWIHRDMDDGWTYLLAVEEGAVVGCIAHKKTDARTLEAQRLSVLPAHRGGAIAKELNNAVLKYAGKNGVARICISIVAQHCALKRWYLRMGFSECETRQFEQLPFKVTYLEYDVREGC